MNGGCICPICGTAFFGDDILRVTCSRKCRAKMAGMGRTEREHLIAEAEKKRRPARIDCRAYNTEYRDCDGLNALWCEVEDCKFYKPREVENG